MQQIALPVQSIVGSKSWFHGLKVAIRVQNDRVVEADRQPSILARMAGSALRRGREAVGLSYDEAAIRLRCEAEWLVRVETGFVLAGPAEAARILVVYGLREAALADAAVDLARRAANHLHG